ncbi:MAG: hypothetical protein L0H29_07535 [Sinobacteraceae bacterium]|nr:hypothetical protein [Nevskiaceae bacterium]
MTAMNEDSQRLIESLQRAVEDALERKRRLGQYAVVWRDGQPAFIGPNPPGPTQHAVDTTAGSEDRAGRLPPDP